MNWSEKLSIKIAERIVPKGEAYNVGQVSHGIELLLLRLLNISLLILLSCFLHCLPETLSIAAIYLLLRNFTGGVHLQSAPACLITGNLLILLSAKLASLLASQSRLSIACLVLAVSAVGFVINRRYAPASHTYVEYEEAVKQRNKRIVLGLLFFGCLLIEILLYLNYRQPGTTYSFAVLLQAFLLHPLAYRVMGGIENIFSRKG